MNHSLLEKDEKKLKRRRTEDETRPRPQPTDVQGAVQRALASPGQLPAFDVMTLQHSMGNRAVNQLLQSQELRITPSMQPAAGPPTTGVIQRQMIDPSYDDEIFEVETAKRQARVQDMPGGIIGQNDPRRGVLHSMLRERQQQNDPRYRQRLNEINTRSSDTSGLPPLHDESRKQTLSTMLRERQQQEDPKYQQRLQEINSRSSDTTGLPSLKDESRTQTLNTMLRERQQQEDPRYQQRLSEINTRTSDTSGLPSLNNESRKQTLSTMLRERQQQEDPKYQQRLKEISTRSSDTTGLPSLDNKPRTKTLNTMLRERQQQNDPKYQKRLKEINTRSSNTDTLKGTKLVSKRKPMHDKIKNEGLLPSDKPIDKSLPEDQRYQPLEGRLPHSLRKTIEFGYATTFKESESKPGIVDTFGDNPEAQSYLSTATPDTNKRLLSQPTEHGRLRELTTPTEFTSMKQLGDTESQWDSSKLRGGPSGAHQFKEHGAHNGPLYMVLNAIEALPNNNIGTQSPPKSGWISSEVEQKAVHFAQTKIDNEIATLAGGNIAGPDSIGWRGGGWGRARQIVQDNRSYPDYRDRWVGPGGIRPMSIADYVSHSDLFTHNTSFSWYRRNGSLGGSQNLYTLFDPSHLRELRVNAADAGITEPSLAALKVRVLVEDAALAPLGTPKLTDPDIEFGLNKRYLYTINGVPRMVKLIEYNPNYASTQYVAVFRMARQPYAKFVVYTAYPL